MASNKVKNTELVGGIVCGLKFINRLMPENIFMLTSGEKNVQHYQKYIFQIKWFNLQFLSGHELPQVFQ